MFIESVLYPSTNLLAAELSKPMVTTSMSTLSPWNTSQAAIDPDLITTLNSSPSEMLPKKSFENSRQIDWKLSSTDSATKLVSTDSKSVCLHAKCSSCFETEAIRVESPFRSNVVTYFEWEVGSGVTGGTSVMFGLCRESTRLATTSGYTNKLGTDSASWALSSKGRLHHNGRSWEYCAPFDDGRSHRIACLVNSINGDVVFYVDGKSMGRAFTNIQIDARDNRLFACLSSTVSRSLFRLLNVVEIHPTLQEICSFRVRHDPRCLSQALDDYRLPKSMIFECYS